MKEPKDEEWLLLMKAVRQEMTEKEHDKFELWIASDSKNQDLYLKIKTDWEKSGNMDIADHPNPDLVWNNIAQSINSTDKKGKVMAINKSWIKYAAAVTILVLGSIWVVPELSQRKIKTFEGSSTEVSTISLSDGSKIWLDQGASLSYQNFDNKDKRQVTLTGRGYFEIARDESKPFQIYIGKARVEVLGTAFNINALSPDQISVDVTHGKVAFGNKSDKVILTKNESGLLNLLNNTLSESQSDDPNFLSWKTGLLVFDDISLPEVCQTLEDHYKEPISISPDLRPEMKLTATFDNQTLTEVVQVIALTLDLTLSKTEDGLRFDLEQAPINKTQINH
ncbi:MAG: FecR domain-containing protein [Cyclobacteriaceae bacterium]